MTNDQRQPGNIPAGDTSRSGVGRTRPSATPRRSPTARTPSDLHEISWRLQPRDYVLAHLLAEHRFLTTDQIAAVLYTSVRTCRNRLNVLRRLGFVTWFMPVHPTRGRLPVHWVPGRLSARYVALVANVGTAMSEAVDDVRSITAILDGLAVTRRWVHADAALAGIPLALLDPDVRPGFDFVDGTDSAIVSGHKFVGAPVPCGVLVVRRSLRPYASREATYTGSPDSTLTNSRSGLAALGLWLTLRRHGIAGLRTRAEQARDVATYAHGRLVEIGWPAHRHPHAFTVVLATPPAAVAQKWPLASQDGQSHIVCMPGVTREQIDAFITDLQAATTPAVPPGATDGHRSRGLLRRSRTPANNATVA
jgi:glutamate/tyrosine decarboxylase-like PLP-dependent enzyme